ncbi:MAG: hypothetical protein IJ864_01920 [Alphaproteobacteria bacterium]|nr:hypothetical protein [Alphaproteobacteria bacterium]
MKILSLVIVFLGYMLVSTANWVLHKFGNVTYEQVMFHLNVPLDAETKLIHSYLQNTVMMASIITIALYIIMLKTSPRKCLMFSILFLIV